MQSLAYKKTTPPGMPSTDLFVDHLIRSNDLWTDYQHWNGLWLLMPTFAYRLGSVLASPVPALDKQGPLMLCALQDGAKVIAQWRRVGNSLELVQRAVRSMLMRSLDASLWRVLIGSEQKEWLLEKSTPISECMLSGHAVFKIEQRTANFDEARIAMLELLRQKVWCDLCARSLRIGFDELTKA